MSNPDLLDQDANEDFDPSHSEISNETKKTEVTKPVVTQAVVVEKKSDAPAHAKVPSIALNNGVLELKDSDELWRVASLFLRSNALPIHFKNTEQVFMAMQYLKARGLDPLVSIRQTMIVNGSINIWGDLPKALVLQSGLCEQFDEILFDKGYVTISFENKNLDSDLFGAACTVKRKGSPAVTKTFTVQQARNAGLIDKDKSLYKKYMERMIQMKARGLAIKDEFSDVISGCAILEYDTHTVPGVENPKSLADELNQRFLEAPAKEVTA